MQYAYGFRFLYLFIYYLQDVKAVSMMEWKKIRALYLKCVLSFFFFLSCIFCLHFFFLRSIWKFYEISLWLDHKKDKEHGIGLLCWPLTTSPLVTYPSMVFIKLLITENPDVRCFNLKFLFLLFAEMILDIPNRKIPRN